MSVVYSDDKGLLSVWRHKRHWRRTEMSGERPHMNGNSCTDGSGQDALVEILRFAQDDNDVWWSKCESDRWHRSRCEITFLRQRKRI